MTQADLLAWRPLPMAQEHSRTSKAAARSIESKAGSIRARLYAWLLANGPATDEQMQDALGLNPSTQRPRRIELCMAGKVFDTKTDAKTKSGRMAILWVAK